jgi:hypothetical protein
MRRGSLECGNYPTGDGRSWSPFILGSGRWMVRKKVGKALRVCQVRTKDFVSVGVFFMKTSTHIVLLNSMREGLDLGPVKPVRTMHIEPEADIRVIPTAIVEAVDFFEGAL